jgi:hypothetical protein
MNKTSSLFHSVDTKEILGKQTQTHVGHHLLLIIVTRTGGGLVVLEFCTEKEDNINSIPISGIRYGCARS